MDGEVGGDGGEAVGLGGQVDGRGDVDGLGRSVEEGDGEWTVQDSGALYRLHGWGDPYFAINAAGHLCVRPAGSAEGGTGPNLRLHFTGLHVA